MSGLSDSAWEELSAAIDGDGAAEPSPVEPEAPEALVQTEPEPTAPDVIEDAPTEEVSAAQPDEPDPRLAELEAREAAIAEREARDAAARAQLLAQMQAAQEMEAEKRSNAYYQELEQLDPDLAKTYLGMRQGILQQRREAEQQRVAAERGLTAAMVAAEAVLGAEQFQNLLSLTENLVTYEDAQQMQWAIQQERQRLQSADAEKQALEKTIKELRSQLEAKERPVLADAVDGGSTGPGHGARLEDAPDFDTFFDQFSSSLPSYWRA